MDARERRQALLLNQGGKRLDFLSSRSNAKLVADSSSPPRKTASGVSPVFSSTPPAGLVNLSAKRKTSFLKSETKTESATKTPVVAAGPLKRAQMAVAKNRSRILLTCSLILGFWFGFLETANAYWLMYWNALMGLICLVAYWNELVKLVKQLLGSKTVGVVMVILLQQAPLVQQTIIDLVDSFSVYYVTFVVAKVLSSSNDPNIIKS